MSKKNDVEQKIRSLQERIERLKAQKELVPTGKFNLTILDEKGQNIHTLGGFESRRDAQMMSNKMYKILATKLHQKVSLQIDPELRKKA